MTLLLPKNSSLTMALTLSVQTVYYHYWVVLTIVVIKVCTGIITPQVIFFLNVCTDLLSNTNIINCADVLDVLQKAEAQKAEAQTRGRHTSKDSLKPPLFLIGALEDDTYLWIIPNSHNATLQPTHHKLKQPLLIKMMKGDIIVCNGLLLHAGYGYGNTTNIRYHMYLMNREYHLRCLYDVDDTTLESFKESTSPGAEIAKIFVEDGENLTNNSMKLQTEEYDKTIVAKRKETIHNKSKRNVHLKKKQKLE